MADAAAKDAAQRRHSEAALPSIPACRSLLRMAIRRHYISRLEAQWHVANTGRDLHTIMPRFSRCLRWTSSLSRRQIALIAQFLTGHYATNEYLCRFGSRTDSSCDWCSALLDDRSHRLLHCPRFDRLRQRLTMEVEASSQGMHSWTWDYLVGPGRHFLARFLDPVRDASLDIAREREDN